MIKVENLKKSFGENDVLKNINAIVSSEVVVVIGPSGSGKSTFSDASINLKRLREAIFSLKGLIRQTRRSISIKSGRKLAWYFSILTYFHIRLFLKNIMLAPIKVRKISKEQASQRGWNCLRKWDLQRKRTHIRIHYQVDKSNASQLPGRWRWNPKSCYSTSPLPPWIRKWSVKSLRS